MRLLFEIVLVVSVSTVLALALFAGLALYNHFVVERKQREIDRQEVDDDEFYAALLDAMDRKWMEKREERRNFKPPQDNRWVS